MGERCYRCDGYGDIVEADGGECPRCRGTGEEPTPLPSPGNTFAGRKVLAVVEGHMDNAKSLSSFHPYSAYQNSYPVTAVILDREAEDAS